MNAMLPKPYRVQQLRMETSDTFTLELEPVNGSGHLDFNAGQFNMLYIHGVGEIPISISSDPTNPKALMHTTREVGIVTRAMRKMKKGDALGIRGPFGTSWPIKESIGSDIVIVAGGIGLAPLRSALYALLHDREKYGKIVLLYGTRSPNDILYRKELQKWRGEFDLEVHVTVDRAMSGWRGNVGVVTALIPKAPFDPTSTIAYVCGPEVMMRFTVQALQKRGVTDDRIYISMERNMKCGIGLCGHCQCGSSFICKDGPVYRYDHIAEVFEKREI